MTRSPRAASDIRTIVILVGCLLLLGGVAVVVSLGLPVVAWVRDLQLFLDRLGPNGYVLLFLIQALATATIAPSAPFSMLAGLMLGALGLPLALAAATTGAALAFTVSRRLGRHRIEPLLARHALLRAMDRAIGQNGWRIVWLTRMSPLIPFNLQNLLFGGSRIGFWPFLIATVIGIVPNTACFVYLGMLGHDSMSPAGPLRWAMLGVGLAATVLVATLLQRMATRATRSLL